MFLKRKRDVPIPDITPGMKENASNKSGESMKTGTTKSDDRPPVEFFFTPMGPVKPNYLKYTPKVTPLVGEQNFDKIDFMMLATYWEDFRKSVKGLNDNHKDIIEEIIDKFEKFTEKGDVQPFDRYKEFIKQRRLQTSQKLPSDSQLRGIYNTWVALRKKTENALMR